ncbi:hypothetical protein NL108_005468, partial [Boleophthalmus pectinirostris]
LVNLYEQQEKPTNAL